LCVTNVFTIDVKGLPLANNFITGPTFHVFDEPNVLVKIIFWWPERDKLPFFRHGILHNQEYITVNAVGTVKTDLHEWRSSQTQQKDKPHTTQPAKQVLSEPLSPLLLSWRNFFTCHSSLSQLQPSRTRCSQAHQRQLPEPPKGSHAAHHQCA